MVEKGKTYVVMGLLDTASIAYAIGQNIEAMGGTTVYTVQNERMKRIFIDRSKKLSAEEKKLQRDLYDSITPEVIEELGPNEMLAKVRKDYYGHPDAKGMEDKR